MGHIEFIEAYQSTLDIHAAAKAAKFELAWCDKEKAKGFYVYGLIDPRNNQLFYIGKGKNGHWQHHKREGLKNSRKARRITEIRKAGLEYQAIYFAVGLKSPEALILERQLIRTVGLRNLTNLIRGNLDVKIRHYLKVAESLGTIRGAKDIPRATDLPLYAQLVESMIIEYNLAYQAIGGKPFPKQVMDGLRSMVYKGELRPLAQHLIGQYDMKPGKYASTQEQAA